ncbi:MAG: branched-chain amino acid ABC transporter substrate-binding protein [Gaiellaceae bacterium]
MRWAAAVFVLGAFLAGCGGKDDAEAVTLSGCTEVVSGGGGKPDVLVVSDLPRRGVGADTTKVMVDAIEFTLRRHHFRAGDYRVGYQSCNDTSGDEPYDTQLCRRNARAYVAAEAVVGIIGPWNSGCAIEQIPIVSRKDAGPLAMISPSNTYGGLTLPSLGAERLYPDGVRSYARVVTHDLAQGGAAVQAAKRLGARRIALVHQDYGDEYVRGLAESFRESARELGLEVREFKWTTRPNYRTLGRSVAAMNADAVYFAGVTELNARRLVVDLRAALGSDVTFLAPDSFAAEEIAKALGPAAEGMRLTVPGIPPDLLPPAGKRFAQAFGPSLIVPRQLGAPEAAQATDVLLDAIARSDGSRASVARELFATRIKNGILGSFSFDRNGDIVPRPVGLYRIERGKIVTDGVVRVPLGDGR